MRAVLAIISVAAVAGLGLATWAFYPAASQPSAPPSPELPLHVSADKLDLGEVWETEALGVELPVENTTDETIQVTGWDRTCASRTVDPWQFTIAPRATRIVRVSLNLTGNTCRPQSASAPAERFETRLTALSGQRPVGPAWSITGRVRGVFLNLPLWVNCGQLNEAAGEAETTSFVVESAVPVRELAVSVQPEIALAAVEPIDTTGRRHRVAVRPTLRMLGERVAALRLSATIESGELLPPREVKIAFQVVRDVQPSTSRLLLGSVRPGETASEVVSFRSLSGQPFEVESPQSLPPGITVDRLDGVGSPAFTVTARGTGSNLLPIEFRARQHGRGDYQVQVELAFHGSD